MVLEQEQLDAFYGGFSNQVNQAGSIKASTPPSTTQSGKRLVKRLSRRVMIRRAGLSTPNSEQPLYLLDNGNRRNFEVLVKFLHAAG